MVRAILDGRKTQTRRILKPQPMHPGFASRHTLATDDEGQDLYVGSATLASPIRCPYGKPSDRLWVRETWSPRIVHTCYDMGCDCDNVWVDYVAGGEGKHFSGGDIPDDWYMPQAALKGRTVPSLHMPRWASRITLEVTGVRVERLNDCSDEDARAEGAVCVDEVSGREVLFPGASNAGSFRFGYQHLWDTINGNGSWASNPWVWVVEFKKV
ncbi:hypothetical protein ACTJK4_13935 [Ralstonia sp. 22111]|uniref:hypothetical protein n=1 Tax=Ralstonia sp. 22111 TaxID=3453878 RepID=UPI003F868731